MAIIAKAAGMDWDDAYANAAHIQGAETFPPKWAAAASAFREELSAAGRAEIDRAYGETERERFDLFLPQGAPKGLAVFVHGGFWKAFDKSSWSHLAGGALANGWAAMLPSYTLCPDIRISGITRQVGRAVEAAAAIVAGPIRIAGHSAGGHLVSRLTCADGPLPEPIGARLERTVSISGLHDLRPLVKTAMNEIFGLDMTEARAESAALLEPLAHASVVSWVGADERPEFLRQNDLLAQMWSGLAAEIECVVEPGLHHFDVIESLARGDGALTRALLSGAN